MADEENVITLLTDQDKEFLKNKTPASLPDNPSDKRWSASQIKLKMYEGYLILYEWLKRLAGESNTQFIDIGTQLAGEVRVEDQDYIIPEEDR